MKRTSRQTIYVCMFTYIKLKCENFVLLLFGATVFYRRRKGMADLGNSNALYSYLDCGIYV